MAKETKQTGTKREAGYAASRRLREQHPRDYKKLLDDEYRRRGIPIPASREDRARDQLTKLAQEYPDIALEVTRGLLVGGDESAAVASSEDSR